MPIKSLDSIVPPVRFRFDGCVITIYEVSKSELVSGDKWYHINLDIEWRGRKCKRFSMDAKDLQDFLKKLMVETSKFKWMVLCGVEV